MTGDSTVMVAQSIGEAFQHTAASGPILLALGACLLAGLVSFASPCVVPLVPGYLAYLAGVVGAERPAVTVAAAEQRRAESGVLTLEEKQLRRSSRRRVVLASLLFVGGFTVVFVLLSAMVLGTVQYIAPRQELLQRLGGVVTILMGLVFIGVVPALQKDTRMQPKALSTWTGAPLLGGVFALGWTPCLGPTLAAALSVAAGTGLDATRGVLLIVAYCLGLGLPFVAVAFGSTWALRTVGWLQRHTRAIQIFGGVMLVLVGLLLLSGAWALFIDWLRDFAISDTTLPI
ncbi:MAG: cytochrome c biogenesis CcdA family protein [Corynebacterium sp.]|uniref:cytochrome c biogenesis CcdA family protein n=1 Tax=Corynebacterium sp. TaxID=1720 RepID=UPI002648B1DB|nr:cytochrome c biogenesis CcdA family protein [Corynebacterium sp.]MDN5723788.1 cytochrome c biogenesis CcdA family protein [Corynebacterium sp.]